MADARLASTSLDWSDPAALVDFWAALLGGEVARGRDEVCTVRTGNHWIAAVRIGDQRPPTWPAADAPKQIHPDQARSGMAEAEASGLGRRPTSRLWIVGWCGSVPRALPTASLRRFLSERFNREPGHAS